MVPSATFWCSFANTAFSASLRYNLANSTTRLIYKYLFTFTSLIYMCFNCRSHKRNHVLRDVRRSEEFPKRSCRETKGEICSFQYPGNSMGALGTRQWSWAHYGDLGNKENFGEGYGSPRTKKHLANGHGNRINKEYGQWNKG